MNEIPLVGCRTEPLMGYLKALGVFRLVSEQKDCDARMYWKVNEAVLQTALSRDALINFLCEEYMPTPLLVPWHGSSFFAIDNTGSFQPSKETPTKDDIIRAFLSSTSERIMPYRDCIKRALEIAEGFSFDSKNKGDTKTSRKNIKVIQYKLEFLLMLRSTMPDQYVDWIDAAMQLDDNRYHVNQLLGGGGGGDSNFHFSDNFMQNLWDCLPDFACQRLNSNPTPSLEHALFEEHKGKLSDRSGSIYDASTREGCNLKQGFKSAPLINPWSFILGMEGLLAFSGGMAKKQGSQYPKDKSQLHPKDKSQLRAAPSFPFLVHMSAAGSDFGSANSAEYSQHEVWLPLWHRPALLVEVLYFFREGRAQVQRRQAQSGLDMARAVATKGVSAGIETFHRYGLVRGRIGGEKYITATSLGSFRVGYSVPAVLFEQLDKWLLKMSSLLSNRKLPLRIASSFMKIERTLTDYCRTSNLPGQELSLAPVVRVMGEMERTLAYSSSYAYDNELLPLHSLSSQWVDATNDNSTEFRLAVSLAGMKGRRGIVGSLRSYLEPIVDSCYPTWRKNKASAKWSPRSLQENMAAIFLRRQLDAFRHGHGWVPLGSSRRAHLSDVVAFLQGRTDDEKISDLMWGLLGVDLLQPTEARTDDRCSAMVPIEYCAIRLLVEPLSLRAVDGFWRWDPSVPPPATGAEAFHALASGRRDAVESALLAALRRLSMQGFQPLGTRFRKGQAPSVPLLTNIGATRLLASMLFPLSQNDRACIADTILTISAQED